MEKLELISDIRAILGEGPTWDSHKNLLYWVDIPGKKLLWFDPKTKKTETIDAPQLITSVVPWKDKQMMVTMQDGFFSLNLKTYQFTPIVNPESELPGNRFNDGKCDASGRFWAGTMDNSEESISGSLYCLDQDFNVRKVLENIGISNGIAWNQENTIMYYIDTPTKQVVAYDFDLASGSITNKRVVVSFENEEGFPDGMTIDEEGMLWVAHWGGYQVSRWNPYSGKKIDRIPLPVAKVTSCVFGGVNLDEMYITTAKVGLTEQELEEQPMAGGLFRIRLGIKGLDSYRFSGIV